MSVWVMVAFYVGLRIGYWLNRKPPVEYKPSITANLVVSKELLDQINQESVMQWLDRRGLTWMPKGAVFDPERTVKK
jgi:hypothetical protein